MKELAGELKTPANKKRRLLSLTVFTYILTRYSLKNVKLYHSLLRFLSYYSFIYHFFSLSLSLSLSLYLYINIYNQTKRFKSFRSFRSPIPKLLVIITDSSELSEIESRRLISFSMIGKLLPLVEFGSQMDGTD